MKIFKGVITYIAAFVACMFLVVTALKGLSDGMQALFAFGVPGLITWWHLKAAGRTAEAEMTRSLSQGNVMSTNAMYEPNGGWPTGQRGASAKAMSGFPASTVASVKQPSFVLHRGTRRQGWIPKGETVEVVGRWIQGMIYVGPAPNVQGRGYGERCRAYIDPAQPVEPGGSTQSGEGMPYWPGYSSIPATCRATYLDWLAGGAKDGSVNAGYMFLYFYGLERRYLIDKPSDDEKRDILGEVKRLRELFVANHSVQRYLGDFIDLASIMLRNDNIERPVFKSWNWELPLSLKVAIGGMVANGVPLTGEWLLSWFLCHPDKRLRTAAQRCEDEFRALFIAKFDQQFPNGLKVAKSKKPLKYNYAAASGEFNADIQMSADGTQILDISGLSKPVSIAQEIADEAMDELDRLSRFLGRNPERKGSFEAHALLPSCLWDIFPSEERRELISWGTQRIAAGGLVLVNDILTRMGATASGKVGKRQLTDVADALAGLGFGLAPDPRHALRLPKEGEPIILFPLDAGEGAGTVSEAYQATLLELALSAFVAHADGQVTDGERLVLADRVARAQDVTQAERKRLKANLDWFLAVPADMAALRSRLKDIDAAQHAALRNAMIAVAHADGIIQTEEVAGIEKIYRILGLDPSTVYSDLHAGAVANTPIRVRSADPGSPGEPIPEEATVRRPVLDRQRIAAIRSDTARVSSVLGQIFQTEHDVEPQPAVISTSPLKGLDAKCAAFVRDVIAKDHWSTEAFEQLAFRHGLMASGALETINEWSFAAYDEALLDEYDGYDVANEIAQALKTQFEKEIA